MEGSGDQAKLTEAATLLEKAGNKLTKAAESLADAGVDAPEVKLLREEVLDVLTRVKAQRDRLPNPS